MTKPFQLFYLYKTLHFVSENYLFRNIFNSFYCYVYQFFFEKKNWIMLSLYLCTGFWTDLFCTFYVHSVRIVLLSNRNLWTFWHCILRSQSKLFRQSSTQFWTCNGYLNRQIDWCNVNQPRDDRWSLIVQIFNFKISVLNLLCLLLSPFFKPIRTTLFNQGYRCIYLK